MKIIKLEDTSNIKQLCEGIEETMIYSCLQGCMGDVYTTDDFQSAQLSIADFCFFLGNPSIELIRNKVWRGFTIIYPQDNAWEKLIIKEYPEAKKHIRYATRKDQDHFDKVKLKSNIDRLSLCYELKKIDEKIYHQVMKEKWSQDLCSQFNDADDFVKRGIGYVITEDNEIVAGASSYTIYNEGIEIEIDTRKDKRRQGLARICASELILACLEKDIYPCWDAHNQKSLDLAISLGYVFDKEYVVYELIDNNLKGA